MFSSISCILFLEGCLNEIRPQDKQDKQDKRKQTLEPLMATFSALVLKSFPSIHQCIQTVFAHKTLENKQILNACYHHLNFTLQFQVKDTAVAIQFRFSLNLGRANWLQG